MTKEDFYSGKTTFQTEWLLHGCDLPKLSWGRLRIFNDGTSDCCFEHLGKLYGFEKRTCAGYFLSEDEYIRFDTMDRDDEEEYGLILRDIIAPEWQDNKEQEFKYLGTH